MLENCKIMLVDKIFNIEKLRYIRLYIIWFLTFCFSTALHMAPLEMVEGYLSHHF